MKGMNTDTGRTITGVEHLAQSIGKILTTPLGSCLQRRTFGSELPDLVDAPNNGTYRIRLYAAVGTALMRWEPRLTLTRIQLADDDDAAFSGEQGIDIEGWTDEHDEAISLHVPFSNRSAR